MIRLNAFFELKPEADIEQVKKLGVELVEASRKDEGNVSYDLFQSTTNPRIMMFCETWADQKVLDIHSAAPHFTRIVPQINAASKEDMHVNRFEF